MTPQEYIRIRGARVHNLKNISLSLPHNQLTVITGVSGSGKSSLAFDTIYAEGQRRYVESLSAYARQFLERMEKLAVDDIDGIAPAIAIRQKNTSRNLPPPSLPPRNFCPNCEMRASDQKRGRIGVGRRASFHAPGFSSTISITTSFLSTGSLLTKPSSASSRTSRFDETRDIVTGIS